ncbi:MAG: AAA family ATPase [Candidatus Poseidoniales archaeon]
MLQVHDSAARWRSFFEETCANEISTLAASWPKQIAFSLDFPQIQSWDVPFAELILNHPRATIRNADTVLATLCRESGYEANPRIRITGLPPDALHKLREISSEEVETFTTSEVIVTKVSELKPRIYNAIFTCTTCGNSIEISQPNELELVEPLECPETGGCGRRRAGGQTRFDLRWEDSTMIDNQWIEVQELPENVKPGSQPVRLSVLAEAELAGKHVPGERIRINGIPYVRTLKRGGAKTPMFDVYISLHSSERKNIPLEEIEITPSEIAEIEEVAEREDLVELFVRSIAPSIIVGEEKMNWIKKSLVFQLLGGVARKYGDGTRTRGDIHILLLGDPGVAKSQILSFMGRISPRGRFTTGGGTSAAGLTAAAVRDAFNDGRFSLEAGALVLADLGLCAVDEFDKMTPDDRGAMHEAMEQQRININKGGISATMPTRCAVLAAANPRDGRFKDVDWGDPSTYLHKQIDLPPPLISRFDMVWMIQDSVDKGRDRRIGEHIIRVKRTGVPEHLIESGHSVEPDALLKDQNFTTDVDGKEVLTADFLQKYVAHSKRTYHPTSDDKVMAILVDHYTEKRQKMDDDVNSVSLTARTIEATLRMAEARARLFLREYVTEEDARQAIAMDGIWRHLANDSNINSDHTGVPKRAQSAERTIMAIVRNLCRELDGECTTPQVYNAGLEQGFDEETIDRVLNNMRNRGDLYSPRIGLWRLN